MAARVTLSCDGEEGIYPCRQAVPVGEVLTGADARARAKKHFEWTSVLVGGVVLDFCPGCIRRGLHSAAARKHLELTLKAAA